MIHLLFPLGLIGWPRSSIVSKVRVSTVLLTWHLWWCRAHTWILQSNKIDLENHRKSITRKIIYHKWVFHIRFSHRASSLMLSPDLLWPCSKCSHSWLQSSPPQPAPRWPFHPLQLHRIRSQWWPQAGNHFMFVAGLWQSPQCEMWKGPVISARSFLIACRKVVFSSSGISRIANKKTKPESVEATSELVPTFQLAYTY